MSESTKKTRIRHRVLLPKVPYVILAMLLYGKHEWQVRSPEDPALVTVRVGRLALFLGHRHSDVYGYLEYLQERGLTESVQYPNRGYAQITLRQIGNFIP